MTTLACTSFLLACQLQIDAAGLGAEGGVCSSCTGCSFFVPDTAEQATARSVEGGIALGPVGGCASWNSARSRLVRQSVEGADFLSGSNGSFPAQGQTSIRVFTRTNPPQAVGLTSGGWGSGAGFNEASAPAH